MNFGQSLNLRLVIITCLTLTNDDSWGHLGCIIIVLVRVDITKQAWLAFA